MNIALTLVLMASAGVVMMRCLCLAAHLNPELWLGRKWQLIGLSMACALLGGGAVGVFLRWGPSSELLVIGLALFFIFDRRKP
jgi:hypothetical protein